MNGCRVFEVWNGNTIELPLVSEDDYQSLHPTIETMVNDAIQNAEIGIPLVHMMDLFGLVIQPLNRKIARLTTVVDDKKILSFLAMIVRKYEQLGYVLIIDESTVLIPKIVETESKNAPKNKTTEIGMEFA